MRLLLVCLGNICRSPMAEGVLRARIEQSPLAGRVEVDSAGTGGWHAGEAPDPRAIACAARHGVDISGFCARQLQRADFERFDWVLCADADNRRDVSRVAPDAARGRISLWLPWAEVETRAAIPDPYTGGNAHFEQVWKRVDAAAAGSVRRLSLGAESGIISP